MNNLQSECPVCDREVERHPVTVAPAGYRCRGCGLYVHARCSQLEVPSIDLDDAYIICHACVEGDA